MSCNCIIVAVSSRRPFLFTILSTTVLVMMMTMTSAQSVTMSLEPREGFKIEDKLEITCSYTGDNLLTFELQKNDTTIVNIQFQRNNPDPYKKVFEKQGFECDLPTDATPVVIKCRKNNLACVDVTQYRCKTNDAVSPLMSLKVKSSIHSLDLMNPPATENQIAVFRCGANVALPTNNQAIFTWTVKRGNNIMDETRMEKRENVPNRASCTTAVYSEFNYNVTINDSSNTTVTCAIFSESLSTAFSIPGRVLPTEVPVITEAGGLDGGAIAGIVLGVIALILLVVLLLWFFVIRKKGDKPASKETTTGPKPTPKDYQIRDNHIYAKSDKLSTKPTGRTYNNATNTKDMNIYTVEGKENPAVNVDDEYDGGAYNERYPPGSAV